MKIKSVELMRNIRDKISSDIEEMQWTDENKYLREHIKSFEFLTKSIPNKALNLTANHAVAHTARLAAASVRWVEQ